MSIPTLKVAGIEISIISMLNFDQQIEPIGGSSIRRRANGAGVKLTSWERHKINLSGNGWVLPDMLRIDFSQAVELELPRPLMLSVGGSLPVGWTSRAAPFDEKLSTDQAGNPVRLIFPKMMVISTGFKNGHGQDASWSLDCETI